MSYVEPNPPRVGSFASQFDRDGDGWLYRRNLRGPAYRITDEERRAFTAAYDRAKDRLLLTLLGVGMLAVILSLAVQPNPPLPSWIVGAVSGGVLVVVLLVGSQWFWREPERMLVGRAPEAPARSWAEASRIRLSRTSWGSILSRAIYLILIGGLNPGHLRNDRWGQFWTAGLMALLLLALVDAIRKWRLAPRRGLGSVAGG